MVIKQFSDQEKCFLLNLKLTTDLTTTLLTFTSCVCCTCVCGGGACTSSFFRVSTLLSHGCYGATGRISCCSPRVFQCNKLETFIFHVRSCPHLQKAHWAPMDGLGWVGRDGVGWDGAAGRPYHPPIHNICWASTYIILQFQQQQ